MPNSARVRDIRSSEVRANVRHLVEVALRGLPQMIDRSAGIFCYAMKKVDGKLVQEGLSPRYTAMTLMGLHRLQQKGMSSPMDSKGILERLLENLDWIENVGDLGLLLWMAAEVAPDRLEQIERRFPISTTLTRFSDSSEAVTMHLAWLLTGLCYYAEKTGKSDATQRVSREAYNLLSQNQGTNGYFGHLARRGLKGKSRGWMGSFADQVYPIIGMAKFSTTFDDRSALQRARDCAQAICEAQGPLGQWWWHYDSQKGRVFEEYPVFSVHQHGMAPMTLLALSEASGTNYNHWIYRGIEWIDRKNELSVNMEDESASVIWRCIRQSKVHRVSTALFGNPKDGYPRGLSVLHECRPYELGWLLYGLAELLG
jgi:hypothetical protein